MKLFITLLALAAGLSAQDLHISASVLQKPTIDAMFGKRLPKIYSAVQIDACSLDNRSLSVPLGFIRQSFRKRFPLSPVTILANAVALQVIQSMQGSTKTAVASRLVFAAAGAAAVGTGFAGVGSAAKSIMTDVAVDGPPLFSLFASVATSTSLVSYVQQSLPETIVLTPLQCAPPSVQLIEGIARSVDFDVTLPAASRSTNGTITVTPQSDGTLLLSAPVIPVAPNSNTGAMK